MTASAYLDEVQQLYIAYFGRPADAAGLTYWADQADKAGGDLTKIAPQISASAESQALYADMTAIQQVAAIYEDLFDRTPDVGGAIYWTDQMTSGATPASQVALAISRSAQGDDAVDIANKITAADAFTAAIGTPARAAAYAGDAVSGAKTYLQTIDSSTPKMTLAASGAAAADQAVNTGAAAAASASAAITLKVSGATVALSGTTGTINLSGADLTAYPAAAYGTVALARASGAIAINNTASGATLSAAGNSAATTFDFRTGVVGGADPVDGALKYTGFKNYVASNRGDTVTLSDSSQTVTGGALADTLVIGSSFYSGSADLKAGANVLEVQGFYADLTRASLSATGGSLGLRLDGFGNTIVMTQEQYRMFSAGGMTSRYNYSNRNEVDFNGFASITDSNLFSTYQSYGIITLKMDNNDSDNVKS